MIRHFLKLGVSKTASAKITGVSRTRPLQLPQGSRPPFSCQDARRDRGHNTNSSSAPYSGRLRGEAVVAVGGAFGWRFPARIRVNAGPPVNGRSGAARRHHRESGQGDLVATDVQRAKDRLIAGIKRDLLAGSCRQSSYWHAGLDFHLARPGHGSKPGRWSTVCCDAGLEALKLGRS